MTSFRQFLSKLLTLGRPTSSEPRDSPDWPVEGVRFAEDGLQAGSATPTRMTWTSGEDVDVELTKSPAAGLVDMPGAEDLRDEQRRLAEAIGRGLVHVDTTIGGGIELLRVVTKGPRGLGYDYIGTVSGSDGQHSYCVRITGREGGTTGRREAVLTALLWQLGELRLPEPAAAAVPQRIEGWFVDPYDPAYDDSALHSIADDERLDVAFPWHPLSRVRELLAQVSRSLVFAEPQTSATPAGAAATSDGAIRRESRRLLSDAIAREVQWTHNCFDVVEAGLRHSLSSVDGPDAERDGRVAEYFLLLGLTQARQGQHGDACVSLSRALDIYETVRGRDDVKTAVTLGHLARAHLELGNLDQAAGLFPQAIGVLERLRPGHVCLAMTLNGYGRLLMATDTVGASEHIQRAADILESLGGSRRLYLLREAAGDQGQRPAT